METMDFNFAQAIFEYGVTIVLAGAFITATFFAFRALYKQFINFQEANNKFVDDLIARDVERIKAELELANQLASLSKVTSELAAIVRSCMDEERDRHKEVIEHIKKVKEEILAELKE